MCGICGIVNFSATEPVRPELVQRMTSVQAHRGPDDAGYFIENNVGLGHRRLSIIDLSGGRQPMYNEDGSVVVVFNGEIYNYGELAPNLTSMGHRFTTKSDTETIVHAYEQYGDDCVRFFRGMFAFAIWDKHRKRLFLVRDRLGIKPVYYYTGKDFFVFASEIKSLLQHPKVPREVDYQAVDLYLALRYVPGPRTIFKNIFKLQPGHRITVNESGIQVRKYWDVSYESCDPHPALRASLFQRNLIEEFEHLFEESVRLRLISDVPLGLFLSGGLDSSAMLAMMSRVTGGERLKTFSVGYESEGRSRLEVEDANEFSYAQEVASRFGAEHHEFRLKADGFRDAISTMVWHLDEPMADPSCIPLYFISKLAREYITVVLSGEGADETLAGYTLYRKLLAVENARRATGRLANLIPALAGLPLGDRARAYLRRAGLPLVNHYRGVVKGLSLETRLALSGTDRLMKSERRLDEIFGGYFKNVLGASPLDQMLYVDAKVWLPEDLLLKADKITMATSIELRVPFLDHKLVEFIATLPNALKVRHNTGKWILRRCMGTSLPPSVLQRAKKGFPSPAAAWFRFELRDFVRDTLLARDSACKKFFDSQAVEKVIEAHEQGKFSGFQEIWSLLVFEYWHKQFIEEFASVPMPEECAIAG